MSSVAWQVQVQVARLQSVARRRGAHAAGRHCYR